MAAHSSPMTHAQDLRTIDTESGHFIVAQSVCFSKKIGLYGFIVE